MFRSSSEIISTYFESPILSQYYFLRNKILGPADPFDFIEASKSVLEDFGLALKLQSPKPRRKSLHKAENFGLRSYLHEVASNRHIPTRMNNLHDFLNVLTWMRFPHLKMALTLSSLQMVADHRDSLRPTSIDCFTHLDEGGVILIANTEELQNVVNIVKGKSDQAKRELFKNPLVIFGHGLLEHLFLRDTTAYAYSLVLTQNEFFEFRDGRLYSQLITSGNRSGSIPVNRETVLCDGWKLGESFGEQVTSEVVDYL